MSKKDWKLLMAYQDTGLTPEQIKVFQHTVTEAAADVEEGAFVEGLFRVQGILIGKEKTAEGRMMYIAVADMKVQRCPAEDVVVKG